MHSYATQVSIQKLLAIFLALAVLFAPAFTGAGEAFAAVPDHHMQKAEAGHCQTPGSNTVDHDTAPAKPCCISMCMAFAIATSPADLHEPGETARAVFTERTLRLGLPVELATPPPRWT